MNPVKHISILGLILLTCFVVPQRAVAQVSPFDPMVFEQASKITEHLEVFTDRSLYVVRESIKFRADLRIQGLEGDRVWSTVLYAELVSDEGLPLSQGKFPLVEGVCQGTLPIPDLLLSGRYFLKCYTRWMRNLGPDSYSYTPLRIIHPLRSRLEGMNDKDSSVVNWERSPSRNEGVYIGLPAVAPGRGEEVLLNLSLLDGIPASELACCLTVVPAQTLDSIGGQLLLDLTARDEEDLKLEFLPDLFGPTLSGRAHPGQKIHLSLLGEKPNYYATVADDFGRFAVAIPDRWGSQELFVAPETDGHPAAEVRVDQDYDPESTVLSSSSFNLSGQEREMATLMARRVQLAEVFERTASPDTAGNTGDPLPFYGKPVFSLELDEFISLPTLSEVFINLVPDVSVLKRKDQTKLVIQGENPALKTYPPLLMVDQIPVFDHQKVLAIPPEKIRRIDVINDIYVKGELNHGGLIHVITHQEDMGGIDLPEGSYFFDFEGLAKPAAYKPEKVDLGKRIPDLRNTMLWIPDLLVNKAGDAIVKFTSSDYPGTYVILVRAVNPGGKIISASARFEVE